MSRRVKYIGSQPCKRDNVCRTKLYWAHPGAVAEVPEEIAVRLLAHREVWREAAPDDIGDFLEIPENSRPMTREEKVAAAIQSIEDNDGWAMVDRYQEDGTMPTSRVEEEPVAGLEDADPEAEQEPAQQDPAQFPFHNDREAAITQAIRMLNPKDEDHFTQTGIPRVEALSKLLGYDVSAEERTRAWEYIQEGEE